MKTAQRIAMRAKNRSKWDMAEETLKWHEDRRAQEVDPEQQRTEEERTEEATH